MKPGLLKKDSLNLTSRKSTLKTDSPGPISGEETSKPDNLSSRKSINSNLKTQQSLKSNKTDKLINVAKRNTLVSEVQDERKKSTTNLNDTNNKTSSNKRLSTADKIKKLEELSIPKAIPRPSIDASCKDGNISNNQTSTNPINPNPSETQSLTPSQPVSNPSPQKYFRSNSVAMNTSKSSNIKVIIRFRPLNQVEQDFVVNNIGFLTPNFTDDASLVLKTDAESLSTSSNLTFKYDKVFPMETTQEQIFDIIGKETILDVCDGYNGTIFTYGQSGSGKTFTMYGKDIYDDVSKGMIPRAIDLLFQIIEDSTEDNDFVIKFSIMQIYKEIVYDLLTGEKDLKVKESPAKGIYVEGISEFYIHNTETFLELLQMSQEQRIVSGTKLNQFSSRSHTIFQLEVTRSSKKENVTKRGMLNMVDLAGTEKISKTGASGETLEEAKKINLSLSALGNVIHALTQNSDHIPYRDSKLTRILQESLGGNYKTTLVVSCSPHSYHLEETLSSLKFAQRAKTIKNTVKMNVKLSYEEMQKIVNKLRTELELANKEIICLQELLKSNPNMGENAILAEESQIIKQEEKENGEKKSDPIEVDETKLNEENPANQDLDSNPVVRPIQMHVPNVAQGEVDQALKAIMNRRKSMLDTTKLIAFKGNFKDLDLKSETSSVSSEDSREKDSEHQKAVSDLEEKIKSLEADIKQKDEIIKSTGKEMISNCKDIYENFKKEMLLKGEEKRIETDTIKEAEDEDDDEDEESLKGKKEKEEIKDPLLNSGAFKLLDSNKHVFTKFSEILSSVNMHNCSDNGKSTCCWEKEHEPDCVYRRNIVLNEQLSKTFNENLQKQNNFFISQNEILLNALDSLMDANIKLMQTYEENKHIPQVQQQTKQTIIDRRRSVLAQPFQPLNKIAKVLNKNNCNLIKEVTKRRMTCEFVPNGGLGNGLGSLDSNNTTSSQNTNSNTNTNNMFFPSLSHFQKMHNIEEIDSENSVASNMSDSKSEPSHIEINPEIEKLKDQSIIMNQLKSIKDFTLQSFKESQQIEKEFEKIKQDLLSNLSKNCMCCKKINKVENDTISEPELTKNNLESMDITCNKQESNKEVTTNNFEHYESDILSKYRKNKNKYNSGDIEIDNESNRINFEHFTITENKTSLNDESLLKTPKINKIKIKGKSEHFPLLNINIEERPINHMILPDSKRRHSGYYNLKTESSLESMWTKYTDVGCASKKFDGLFISMDESDKYIVKCRAGISCMKKTKSPNHSQLQTPQGDDSFTSVESFEF